MKSKLLLLLFVPCILFSQSTLGKAKGSLSSSSNSSVSSSSDKDEDDDDDSIGGAIFESIFESIFLDFLGYVSYGVVIGEGKYTEITPYPYFDGKSGEFTRIPNEKNRRTNVKLNANYFVHRVNGIELNAVVKPIPLIGVELDYLSFNEEGLFTDESLNITSINMNYYRVRENTFSMWWGIGGTYVGNEVDTWGASYNIGTDIYPVKPISFHLGWKQSFVNDNTVNVFKSQVKYHIKRTALYTGYHNYKLGSETISGLVLGIEYSF